MSKPNRPKLTTLRSALSPIRSRLSPLPRPSRGGGSPGLRWSGRKLQVWRERILAAEPLCRHCKAQGLTTVAQEVDHLVPLEQGGDYSDGNAQPLCIRCHATKTALDRGYRSAT